MVPDNGSNGTELVMGSGSTTTQTEIPAFLEDAAKRNLARGSDVADLGYVPYFGPDVAAFTPMQQASFQNTGQAANAFGMSGGGLTGMEGMPQAQQFAGGVSGYSSAPMFLETLQALEQNNPGQLQAIRDMFINPQTGEGGYQPPMPMEQPMSGQMLNGGNTGGGSDNYNERNVFNGGSDRVGGNSFQGPNQNGDVGYGSGGYTSIFDRIDGGGPGVSGGAYSGGGRLSDVGNIFTRR
jgi:hypothetical protein